jgi:hypothetical protein
MRDTVKTASSYDLEKIRKKKELIGASKRRKVTLSSEVEGQN